MLFPALIGYPTARVLAYYSDRNSIALGKVEFIKPAVRMLDMENTTRLSGRRLTIVA